MRFRSFVLLTHRWVGLTTAVTVAILGATGVMELLPSRFTALRHLAGPLHERLALGQPGYWVVVATTGTTLLLLAGGLILWWKQKHLAVRLDAGWRRALFDLHHSAGIFAWAMMALLTVTGVGMAATTPEDGELRRIIFNLHTTRGYGVPIKLLYALGSFSFVVQGVSGVIMWWKPGGRRD
jgi:uncharacterized iron-regulated membrane protein